MSNLGPGGVRFAYLDLDHIEDKIEDTPIKIDNKKETDKAQILDAFKKGGAGDQAAAEDTAAFA